MGGRQEGPAAAGLAADNLPVVARSRTAGPGNQPAVGCKLRVECNCFGCNWLAGRWSCNFVVQLEWPVDRSPGRQTGQSNQTESHRTA